MSLGETIGVAYFTGREKLIQEVMHSLEKHSGALLIDDTQGIQGIGKTTFTHGFSKWGTFSVM